MTMPLSGSGLACYGEPMYKCEISILIYTKDRKCTAKLRNMVVWSSWGHSVTGNRSTTSYISLHNNYVHLVSFPRDRERLISYKSLFFDTACIWRFRCMDGGDQWNFTKFLCVRKLESLERLPCTVPCMTIDPVVLTRYQRSALAKLEMWANAQPDGRPAEYR